MLLLDLFVSNNELNHGSYGQGKSGKVGKIRKSQKVRENQSTRVQKLTKMQKKITVNKFFSDRFACRLFVSTLLNLFHHLCF